MSTEKKKGGYLGTEIDRKWWKRYKKDGMLARGNGEFWMDAEGMHFHRYLLKTEVFIPWKSMTGFDLGKWHAGKWLMSYPAIKVDWEKDSQKLCSGFVLSKDWDEARQFIADLAEKIAR